MVKLMTTSRGEPEEIILGSAYLLYDSPELLPTQEDGGVIMSGKLNILNVGTKSSFVNMRCKEVIYVILVGTTYISIYV